jgi:predicted deacylase
VQEVTATARAVDFDPGRTPRGGKSRTNLVIDHLPDGQPLAFPALVVRGAEPGRTLLATGVIHGDEYEGIAAIPQIFASIDSAQLSGRLVMVPVCNPPAYRAAQRSSPIDGLNLARVFPGAVDGSITRRIAYWMVEKLLRQADFMIDLHTGGIAYEIPLLIGYVHDEGALGQAALAGARAFGAPTLWGHPLPIPPGRSLSAATDLGLPCVYTEAPGGAGIDLDVLACFRTGVFNVMKHLGMIAGQPERRTLERHLVGHGELDSVISAPAAGLFLRECGLLDEVEAGQRLGTIRDECGDTIAEVTAQNAGVVIMLRGLPRVGAGDGLVHLAQPHRR